MSESAVPLDSATERNLRRLKAVVIILGVLLVLGVFALIAGIIWKASGPKTAAQPTTQTSSITGPGGGAARLEIPKGASIVDMDLHGNRILLRIQSAAGEELIIYDAGKNQVVARVALESQP